MRKDNTTTTRSTIAKGPHPKKMKNTFSKIDKEQIRTASTIIAVLELQENKRCLATTTINKKTKVANGFTKGARKSRITGASQSHKKAIIVNQKAIKPAHRASIAVC